MSCNLPYEKQIKSTSVSLYLMWNLKIDNIAWLPWCTLTTHFKHVLLYLGRVTSPSPQIFRKHEITKRACSQKPPRIASTALWLELDYDGLLMWSACVLPRTLSSHCEDILKGRHWEVLRSLELCAWDLMEAVANVWPTVRPLEIGSLSSDFRLMTSNPETNDGWSKKSACSGRSKHHLCMCAETSDSVFTFKVALASWKIEIVSWSSKTNVFCHNVSCSLSFL